ncbi:hypothetical protein H2198_010679 [Neophaeococcomyces mojaviensis]|uniref:Uncharacterized protein n=1 Tax=Neophaeococcomyces mojaviensis TaxID=3383035 RepID=A0ACC2ZQW1_9EURO|nr:hypothetical protein H2198_010679 [Knufia sp. JES_112]
MEQLPSLAHLDPPTEESPSLPTSQHSTSSESPINEQDVQELLKQYPFAAEASYFTRPNRYEGPASTWRSWTAHDRAVADAVEQERATDLSAHLFNAFALRKKAGATLSSDRGRELRKSVSMDMEVGPRNEGQDRQQHAFIPPGLWTAWPLPSRDVPRHHQRTSRLNGYDNTATNIDMMPSAQLEDAVIATTLKHARETWDARSSERTRPRISQKKRNWKLEKEMTTQKLIDSGAIELKRDNGHGDEDTLEEAGTSEFEDTEATSGSDVELPEGIQTFSSQAFLAEDLSSSESESLASDANEAENRPLFLADDSEARHLLMPSTRHTLSKLDDLLTGLHKARRAHAVRGLGAASTSLSHSRSRTLSRERQSGAVATKRRSFIRSGTLRSLEKYRKREQRGRKRRASASSASGSSGRQASSDEVLEDASKSDFQNPRRRSQHRHSSVQQYGVRSEGYGLRDWSDIIGMATLTGWKTETVARAAERCASLFNENMMFRTFYEADQTAPLPTQKRQKPYYEEVLAYVSDEHDAKVDYSESEDAVLQNSFSDTIGPQYVRSSSPCVRCRQHKLRCSPSLPTAHEAVADRAKLVSCAACALLEKSIEQCSGITVRLEAPKTESRTCPYPDCQRYTIPFAKRYHLDRHLRNVHSDSPVLLTSDATQSPSRPSSPRVMLGPKASGLTCPISSCPRSGHVYARPTRLYAHIRKEHPELDLDNYKSLMGQGNNKGKYDRSQSRSARRRRAEASDKLQGEEVSDVDDTNEGGVKDDIKASASLS